MTHVFAMSTMHGVIDACCDYATDNCPEVNFRTVKPLAIPHLM